MERKDYIIIILVIALVGIVSFSSALLLVSPPKIVNSLNNSFNSLNNPYNSSNNSSDINTTVKTSKNTNTEISTGKEIDLSGYVLTEVRDVD